MVEYPNASNANNGASSGNNVNNNNNNINEDGASNNTSSVVGSNSGNGGAEYMDGTTRTTFVKLIEEHITTLVREAISVQRHSKRARIHTTDIILDTTSNTNTTTSILNRKGSGTTTSADNTSTVLNQNRLHAADINMALQLMGSEKLYGIPLLSPEDMVPSANSNVNTITSSSNNKRIYLQEFLRSEEIPPPPVEVSLQYHWLAVDGIQPEISQNPTAAMKDSLVVDGPVPVVVRRRGSGFDETSSATDNVTVPYNASVLGGDGSSATNPPTTVPHASVNGSSSGATAGAAAAATATLRINQLQSSLLSEELKLYFTRVTTAIEHGSASQQDLMLQSVASDPGLQELVPFFIRYCQKELFRHINNTTPSATAIFTYDPADYCRTLIRLVRSLLYNPQLHLELHLHEILPALVTCVVAEKLCSGTSSSNTTGGSSSSSSHIHQQHWILRYDAACALYEACQLFHEEYPSLKSRIIRALCKVIAPTTTTPSTDSNNKKKTVPSLASQYGGIVGITMFGSRSIDTFLIPMILANWEDWEYQVVSSKTSAQRKYEIQVVQQACLNALGIYLRKVTLDEKVAQLSWNDHIEDIFYDRLIPILGEPTEYATCFI